ncbi:MAG: FecR domain-containing protein, partial [Gammaproteobacteria bacterium]|nr:FecR domain-containing protein [Gammaproteobacteria bacterium]
MTGATLKSGSRDNTGFDETYARTNPEILSADATVVEAVSGGNVKIPFGDFLLKADYIRQGSDLVLSGKDGIQVVVKDYFAVDQPPILETELGAQVLPNLAARLSGPVAPVQYAETVGGASGAKQIGEVRVTSGDVSATHKNGTSEKLVAGSSVYEGDILQTGSGAKIVIVFSDDTRFALGANARMTLDKLVYNPSGGENTLAVSMVQGAFTFVSGQIAKFADDNMTIQTPVGTLGIRGTEGGGFVAVIGQTTTLFISVGSAVLKNIAGTLNILAGFGAQLAGNDVVPQLEAYSVDRMKGVVGEDLSSVLPSLGGTQLPSLPGQLEQIQPGAGGGEQQAQGGEAEPAAAKTEVVATEEALANVETDPDGEVDEEAKIETELAEITQDPVETVAGPEGSGDPLQTDPVLTPEPPTQPPTQVVTEPPLPPPSNTNDVFIHNAGAPTNAPVTVIDAGGGEDTLTIVGTQASENTVTVGQTAEGTMVINITAPTVEPEQVNTTGIEDLIIDFTEGDQNNTVVVGPLGLTDIDPTTVIINGGGGQDEFDASGTDVAVRLFGGAGADTLLGGAASDLLEGAGSGDVLDGGGGFNTISYLTSPSGVIIDLRSGAASGGDAAGDTIVLDTIQGVIGSNFDDTIGGDAANNVLDGAEGNDTLSYATSPTGVTVDLGAFTATGDGDDFVIGFENVIGSANADVITGDAGANIIDSGAGADTITYGVGDGLDTVDGGSERDEVVV